jgi:hypothetical protein
LQTSRLDLGTVDHESDQREGEKVGRERVRLTGAARCTDTDSLRSPCEFVGGEELPPKEMEKGKGIRGRMSKFSSIAHTEA